MISFFALAAIGCAETKEGKPEPADPPRADPQPAIEPPTPTPADDLEPITIFPFAGVELRMVEKESGTSFVQEGAPDRRVAHCLMAAKRGKVQLLPRLSYHYILCTPKDENKSTTIHRLSVTDGRIDNIATALSKAAIDKFDTVTRYEKLAFRSRGPTSATQATADKLALEWLGRVVSFDDHSEAQAAGAVAIRAVGRSAKCSRTAAPFDNAARNCLRRQLLDKLTELQRTEDRPIAWEVVAGGHGKKRDAAFASALSSVGARLRTALRSTGTEDRVEVVVALSVEPDGVLRVGGVAYR